MPRVLDRPPLVPGHKVEEIRAGEGGLVAGVEDGSPEAVVAVGSAAGLEELLEAGDERRVAAHVLDQRLHVVVGAEGVLERGGLVVRVPPVAAVARQRVMRRIREPPRRGHRRQEPRKPVDAHPSVPVVPPAFRPPRVSRVVVELPQ